MTVESLQAAYVQPESTPAAELQQAPPVVPVQEPAAVPRYDTFSPDETPKGVGLYRPVREEDGSLSFQFDAPSGDAPGDAPAAEEEESQVEMCTVNTDKVDREIKQLKEEKQQLEQAMQRTQDPTKQAAQEKQLAALEAELLTKDTDTYRKLNASYTYG